MIKLHIIMFTMEWNSMKNKFIGCVMAVLLVVSVFNPAFTVFAVGETITVTDSNGNEITEKIEVQEYRNVQLSYTISPSMPEGAYVTWKSNLPLLAGVDDSGKVTGYDYSKAAIIQLWIDENIRSLPLVGEAMAKSIEDKIASSGVDIETVNTDVLVAIVSGVAGEQLGESLRNYLDNMNVVITATLYSADGVKIADDSVEVLVTQSVVAQVMPTGVHITNKKTVPTTVAVGTTVRLYGAVTPVRLKQGVKWSVDKTIFESAKGDVTENGLVTFTEPGTLKIKVTPTNALYAAFSDSITFTVVAKEELPVTDFSISGSLTVQEGESSQLAVSNVVPAGAYTGDAVWTSSDPSVVIVDQEGNITGLDGGSGITYSKKATVSVTIGDVTKSVDVEVKRGAVQGNINNVEIEGEDALGIGNTSKYTATVYPTRLNTSSSIVREWGIIDDDGNYIMATQESPASTIYGTIDFDGNLTANASGIITIVARATNKDVTVETTKSVFFGNPITDFNISGSLEFTEGKTSQLTITNINPEDYDEQILQTIKWTSENPKIAMVGENGLVYGVDGGNGNFLNNYQTTKITATVGGVSKTVTVKIKKATIGKLTQAHIDGFDYVIKDFPVTYNGYFSPERINASNSYWGIVSNDGQVPFDDSLNVSGAKYTENDFAKISEGGTVTALNAGETDIYLYGKQLITAYTYVQTSKRINTVEIEPKSITVTAPTKTDYVEGDTQLDLTGLKVQLTYDRADIEKYYGDTSGLYQDSDLTVEVTDYTVGEINPKILDTEQYIVLTVTRAGKSYRGVFSITLASKAVESIELTAPRYKYIEGETELDLESLTVKANYSNAPSEEVTDYRVHTEDFDPTLYNVEQNITVSYTHEGRTATATFPVIVYGIPVVSVDTNGYSGEWTPNNITFTLSATNELDGLTYYYRTEGGSDWTAISGNTFTVNTDLQNVYYFKAVNSAEIDGTETEGFTVKRDSVTPYFVLNKEINDVTNQNFKITIDNLRVGLSGIKSITVNGEDITGNTEFLVTENNNYSVTVTANNGLSKTLIKTVNNIDREPPVINRIDLKHKTTGTNARELAEEEYGLFFNETVEMTVWAVDKGIASVGKIEYRLIDETGTPLSEEWLTYNELERPLFSPNFKGVVEVKATDKAGNESAVYRSDGFVIDGENPTIEVNAVSKGKEYENGVWTSDTVDITVSSYAFSGIYEYLYRVDGGDWKVMDKPNISFGEEGEHILEFKTVSYSALESDIVPVSVKIDRQMPVIRVEFQGTFKRWTGENMTFSFSTLEPSISGVTYYYNDGSGWKEITTGNQIVLYDNINANYQFMAVNGAGTKSPPSDSYIVMIDTVVPEVSVTPEVTGITVDPYKVHLDYSFGEAGLKSVTLNGEDITGAEFITVSKNGTYLITVTGNNLKTSNYLLTVDNFYDPLNPANKPVLQVTVEGAVGVRTGDDITFKFLCPDGQEVTYYYDSGDGWTEIEGNSLTLSESTVADYKFKAVNNYGVESYESPVYSVILDKSQKTGASISGNISFEYPENTDTVTVKLYDFGANNLIAKKTVASDSNKFSFDSVENGVYFLVAECAGYQVYRIAVFVSGDTVQNIDFTAGEIMIGDIDLDGDIDSDDYELLSSYVKCNCALNEIQLKNADVNGDGTVDGIDALYLNLYLHGAVQLP